MGGKSTTSQQTAQVNQPWKPAIPGLEKLIGATTNQIGNAGPSAAETGALNSLQANANQGNPFAPQITGIVGGLLGGGPDRSGMVTDANAAYAPAVSGNANTYSNALGKGLSDYETGLSPYTSASYLDPMSNPATAGLLSTIQNRIADNVNGMFAGAGRDLSGAHMRTLGQGISEGVVPVLFDQYNKNVATQRGAQDALLAARGGTAGSIYGAQDAAAGNIYGAANNTAGILSGMDQQKFANQQAGIDAAPAAQEAQNASAMQTLMIEAMRRGIPIESLSQLTGILGPIAGLGGTSTGTAQGTQQMSGAQQFAMIAGGLNSLFGKTALPI